MSPRARHGAIRVRAIVATAAVALGFAGAGAAPPASAIAGNAASSAVLSSSATLAGSASSNLTDHASLVSSGGVGASWIPVGGSTSWAQLSWTTAPTLTSVSIFGDRVTPGRIARGTLTFDDGSTLAVGRVAADPRFPTTIAFAPKSTRSVRFTIDAVAGSGTVALAEIAAMTVGSSPIRPSSAAGTESGIGLAVSTLPPCAPATPPPALVLTVLCPTSGTVVDGPTTVTVAAPNSPMVEAVVWHSPATGNAASIRLTAVPDSSGIARITFDASPIAHGPITVNMRSTPRSGPRQELNFQLINGGGVQAKSWMPPTQSSVSSGMTLAFAEEFTAPVSFTRIGDADFGSAKPEWYGAQEFGKAVFADPSAGLNNLLVVDDDYLRIAVSPRPASFADPMGWNRAHIGGMISSGRVGGAGFSAQFGYFEARMLVPAGNGLWPAFWLLPSDNLSVPQLIGAEIDVMEQYGQKPIMSCQSTHQYTNGVATAVNDCGDRFPTTQAALGWHTYGVKVNPDNIVFYIDGAVVATLPQIAGGDRPMYFMVNLALSGDQWWPVDLAPIGDSAAMYVDYIRVYT